jgi:hypothetical protein
LNPPSKCSQTSSKEEKNASSTSYKYCLVCFNRIVRASDAIAIADLNQDGKKDIICMTIHNYGNNERGKASVFWMEYYGREPSADNWITHIIKMSDGYFTGQTFRGEKWDHCRFVDIDDDGDLDIIGNCEEYYQSVDNHEGGKASRRVTQLGVAWFENSLFDQYHLPKTNQDETQRIHKE